MSHSYRPKGYINIYDAIMLEMPGDLLMNHEEFRKYKIHLRNMYGIYNVKEINKSQNAAINSIILRLKTVDLEHATYHEKRREAEKDYRYKGGAGELVVYELDRTKGNIKLLGKEFFNGESYINTMILRGYNAPIYDEEDIENGTIPKNLDSPYRYEILVIDICNSSNNPDIDKQKTKIKLKNWFKENDLNPKYEQMKKVDVFIEVQEIIPELTRGMFDGVWKRKAPSEWKRKGRRLNKTAL